MGRRKLPEQRLFGYLFGFGRVWPALVVSGTASEVTATNFAFVSPSIVLVVIGMPLILLERGVGQKFQVGPLQAWRKIHPSLAGIGMTGVLVTFFVALYYNMFSLMLLAGGIFLAYVFYHSEEEEATVRGHPRRMNPNRGGKTRFFGGTGRKLGGRGASVSPEETREASFLAELTQGSQPRFTRPRGGGGWWAPKQWTLWEDIPKENRAEAQRRYDEHVIAENAKKRPFNFDYINDAPREARDLVKDKIARQLWQELYGATGGTGPQGRRLGADGGGEMPCEIL